MNACEQFREYFTTSKLTPDEVIDILYYNKPFAPAKDAYKWCRADLGTGYHVPDWAVRTMKDISEEPRLYMHQVYRGTAEQRIKGRF